MTENTGLAKSIQEAHKQKQRNQMHHDLCLLSAGAVSSIYNIQEAAELAIKIYKLLWLEVLKEIP